MKIKQFLLAEVFLIHESQLKIYERNKTGPVNQLQICRPAAVTDVGKSPKEAADWLHGTRISEVTLFSAGRDEVTGTQKKLRNGSFII
jgi:hypothetical protein